MTHNFYRFNKQLLLEKAFDKSCEPVCKDFIKFCKQHLDLQDRVKISFITTPDPDITTGCYVPSERSIKVLTKDRGLVDILRSVAHEMVHQYQHVTGKLNDKSGETGSVHENEAHSLAGVLMRLYHEKHKNKIY